MSLCSNVPLVKCHFGQMSLTVKCPFNQLSLQSNVTLFKCHFVQNLIWVKYLSTNNCPLTYLHLSLICESVNEKKFYNIDTSQWIFESRSENRKMKAPRDPEDKLS